jgi:hypothetical protein
MFKTRASSCQALDGSKVASQIIRVHNGSSRASAMVDPGLSRRLDDVSVSGRRLTLAECRDLILVIALR